MRKYNLYFLNNKATPPLILKNSPSLPLFEQKPTQNTKKRGERRPILLIADSPKRKKAIEKNNSLLLSFSKKKLLLQKFLKRYGKKA
ncbi:MAG: hypothetical protein CSA95_02630 [Bacteroidetes bacterium]|nr:MAG: hypothetical protein CSA95_02630 [Bacteroidota bacterium]